MITDGFDYYTRFVIKTDSIISSSLKGFDDNQFGPTEDKC